MSAPLLKLKNLTKCYGEFYANKNVSLTVQAGSIHALIGENGAGKSTLMKMIFGMEHPTEGQVVWKGSGVQFKTAQAAKKAGIGMVHQHFMQAEQMTALDHLALEMSARVSFWKRLRPIPWTRLREEARALANTYQMKIPWEKAVSDLSVIEQQRLEILKLLSEDAELFILDEPTAVLSPLEIRPVLERLLALKKSGKSIILISHKLKEVTAIADQVSVLRRGELIWSGPVQDKSENELASLMIGNGFKITDLSKAPREAPELQNILQLQLQNIYRSGDKNHPLFQDLKLEIKAGEILGFAGVEGNGQSDLAELMLFPQRFAGDQSSQINYSARKKEPVNLLGLSSQEIRKKGVGWIPPDRHQQAVILPMKASENLALGHQNSPRYSTGPLMRWKDTLRDLKSLVAQFDVRPASGDPSVAEYSGGNQQKLVVGREFEASPELLIAEHPTRGVDLAAAVKIHEALRSLKKEQSAVILISSDLDELTQVCDRIVVFYRHQIQAEFLAGNFNIEEMGRAMAGLSDTPRGFA